MADLNGTQTGATISELLRRKEVAAAANLTRFRMVQIKASQSNMHRSLFLLLFRSWERLPVGCDASAPFTSAVTVMPQ